IRLGIAGRRPDARLTVAEGSMRRDREPAPEELQLARDQQAHAFGQRQRLELLAGQLAKAALGERLPDPIVADLFARRVFLCLGLCLGSCLGGRVLPPLPAPRARGGARRLPRPRPRSGGPRRARASPPPPPRSALRRGPTR